MNRIKNGSILLILIIFLCLCLIAFMPVNCVLKTVTGIYCPACGMTRSFLSILNFNFIDAIKYNLLGIPLFIAIILSITIMIKELMLNQFNYIPKLLKFFEKHYIIILVLLGINMILNNIKGF